ncbi:MAG: porin [Lysobacteraceae bacterium]
MRASISALLCGGLLPFFSASAATGASDWTFTPGGQIQHDLSWLNLDDREADFAEAPRRTRLGFALEHVNGVRAKFEWDFIAGTITDSFIELPLNDHTRLRAGQYKQPFALEELISDREPAMLETSMPADVFALARRSGIAIEQRHASGLITLSRYFGHVEELDAGDGWALRSTWSHGDASTHIWHLGIAAASDRDHDGRGRIRSRQELRTFSLLAADSGNLDGVAGTDRVGLEQAWLSGPWLWQSEQMSLRLRRMGSDVHAKGGYALLSWTSGIVWRSYKDGVVKAPKLSQGHAWEFAARVSTVDIEYAQQNRGQQTNLSAGVNLYVGPHWRFMLDQTWVNGRRLDVLTEGSHTSLRMQADF